VLTQENAKQKGASVSAHSYDENNWNDVKWLPLTLIHHFHDNVSYFFENHFLKEN